jgi:putative membrane protein
MSRPLHIPYCGTPPDPAELWLRWNLDPVLLIALAALLYMHARGTGMHNIRRGYFAAGWAAVVLGLVGPICALGVSLFSARVTQHMWLVFIAAPLLVLASANGAVRVRGAALLSCGLFAGILWVWHVPSMYALTFASDLAYWLMHITLTGSAFLLWQALLRGPSNLLLARLGAGFVTLMHMGLLGALITLAPRMLYSPHVLTSQVWGLSPLEDQQLGGLIMWVPAGVAMIVACLASVLTLLRSPAAIEPPAEVRG